MVRLGDGRTFGFLNHASYDLRVLYRVGIFSALYCSTERVGGRCCPDMRQRFYCFPRGCPSRKLLLCADSLRLPFPIDPLQKSPNMASGAGKHVVFSIDAKVLPILSSNCAAKVVLAQSQQLL
jgi:hypothetical protein